MILLLGGSGVAGRALQERFNSAAITLVSRENATKWMGKNGSSHIETFLDRLLIKPSLIINAVGLTNPLTSESELMAANYQLPVNLVTAGKSFTSKIVTFGSIMEELPHSSNNNTYLKSKQLYRDFLGSDALIDANFLHLQFHTWYGGIKLHEHMFLGQLLRAIRETSLFEMSGGSQLREYHHISDDMNAVAHLISLNSSGVQQVNHGESHSLKDIAEHVLGALGAQELLYLGSLPTDVKDNFIVRFSCPEILQQIQFRPTLSGIVRDFQERLKWLG